MLGWLWRWVVLPARWVALPAACLLAVGLAMTRGPLIGAAVASAFFLIVLVYAMLVQMAHEGARAASRWHEGRRRELEASYSQRLAELQEAKDEIAALRAQRARFALQVAICEEQARARDA
ncbi:hypothetical protein POL25_23790 [Nannocystis sp. bb15-2]|uniref:Uncharacterized protein n=1 Tax=Nannocystis bainbridge TaxID=2995303 RepID=A0ABT5E582_9BACT|nr:hypothetical protein [Nannocystis bainbridge]